MLKQFLSEQIITATFLQGIIVELVGGFLFIMILLFVLRPKFEISPVIIKYRVNNNQNWRYAIKVVNKSIFYAIDVNVTLSYYILVPSANSRPHKDNKTLVLVNNTYPFLPNRFNKDNEFALWFMTDENLEDYMNPQSGQNNTILFRVIMKHGLTGLATAKSQEYAAAGQIIENHYFQSGHSFNTVRI